ncbi:hypothetical protein [Microbispora triticiradicis]|uniref:hypothetical protein n=1 Tax=Microbispora triticiradicis TaxID=2200763 RepID=UPI001AD6CD87|nr:hypothetical protein [Microbispora triticiradicis]MBO4271176.1 hypothetical protein [Microbispora triticiradicis]
MNPAPASAAAWQKWGAWKTRNSSTAGAFKCRLYIEAVTTGSRILFTGAMQCTKPVNGLIYVNSVPGTGGLHTGNCVQPTEVCTVSWYENNPSGSQDWHAATTGYQSAVEIPSVNIVFRA